MKKRKADNIVIMNFSHIYEQEKFLQNARFQWIDCTDVYGCNCYCDSDAINVLQQKIAIYPPEGIHFIDSGNYHYVTKLWTDKIEHPFSLVVFDHHPDMQPSLFEGLMSCGCWVKTILDTNPQCKKVCIIGASEKLINEERDPIYKNRLVFYSENDLKREETWKQFAAIHIKEPIYISVDKDVLSRKYAITNWDQGTLSLEELKELLDLIIKKQQIIGVDICGECSDTINLFNCGEDIKTNNCTNKDIFLTFADAKPLTVVKPVENENEKKTVK
jgi:hypothetical protein